MERTLENTVALVAGGTGNVGRAIVRGLLARGATVVVPSRTPAKLSALREGQDSGERRRLVTLSGNIGDERDAELIRGAALDQAGRIDAVVASLGRFVPSPSLLSAPLTAVEGVLDDYVLAHFVVARTFIPRLMELGGSYTFINGMLAFSSMPGSGLVSVATAAQAMLAEVLFRETADSRARVNELVLHVGIGWGSAEETERNGRIVADAVANIILSGSAGARSRVAG
jgi:NAD(P)-dependent dehydrogenase (short-subunit alcohol dehydrogenase family)